MNATPTHQREVAGLWIGDTLPPIAELCIRTWLDHGISFRLFTYRDYDNIPEGTNVQDASQIIPKELVFRHDNGSLAPFADWFRNTWLEQAGGFWTDLDVACLSPDLPRALPWFAEQQPGLVAVGVIGFPPHHPLITCLKQLSEDPAAPMPWDTTDELAAKRQFALDSPDAALRRQRAMWGNAGPEGFTRALIHFDLLDDAAPSSSIYPLHYTVWRNCYNGALGLGCGELKNSWAIHLWGELLRREPDAFENVHRGSIVGQLLDKHAPLREPARRGRKKKTRILVGIGSCVGAAKRRQAVRSSWMRQNAPGITCLFFLGRRTPLDEERDVVSLWVHDDYDHLPEKVLAFFRYALAHYDFEWLFKCYDDTYIDLHRLADLPDAAYDLIGDPSLKERGAPSGGAGYFLSRALVEQIVAMNDIPATGAEDLIFGELAARLGAKTLSTDRLNMNPAPYPMEGNDLVTAHWCPPEHLLAIENFRTAEPIAVYTGIHTHWADTLLFYANGTFRRKTTGCAGRYVFQGRRSLTLEWFRWAPEHLRRRGDTYAGADLTLTPAPGQPCFDATAQPEAAPKVSTEDSGAPLLIQLGCGSNILPGWVNLDIEQCDITEPLPWEDGSVDAYFLEHVIEHVLPWEAYEFLLEAWRTLKPGGIVRLAFPDLLRIAEKATPAYILFLKERGWGDGTRGSAVRSIIENNGHLAVWTSDTMKAVLESIGYDVSVCATGQSAHPHLQNIESHGSQLGHAFNELETSCLEARKTAE